MKTFKSSLILRTTGNREYKLPETSSIISIQNIFTIDPSGSYIYAADNPIQIYTTFPYNLIDTINYKKNIKDLLKTKNDLFILDENTLVSHSKDNFNEIVGNFENCRLLNVFTGVSMLNSIAEARHGNVFTDSRTFNSDSKPETGHIVNNKPISTLKAIDSACDEQPNAIGVQSLKELTVYDFSLNKLRTYRGQCSYSIKDILIIGDFNNLKIYIKDNLAVDIAMPDYIKCVLCDPLFSRVYCATQEYLYCLSTSGDPMIKMDYHSSPIKNMKLNMSADILYTLDGKVMCVWDAINCVVIGYTEFDNEVFDFDIFVDGNRKYDFDPYNMK